jgi:biotin carboxyl carrier protein
MVSDVVAPIPGKVLRVNSKVGDSVTVDTSVVTLESMKMEIDVFPDSAGVVKEILVKPGEFAEQGKVLIKVE